MFRYRFWIFVFVIIAVACVASIVSLSRYRRHHAELLSLQAANQADSVFSSDTLQRRLVRYFDRYAYTPDGLIHPGRTANDRLLAHYLLGRAYADMGDAPMAIQAYREAVDCADTTRTDCNYAVMRSVYGQMSLLYHYQNLPNEELEALKNAEHCNWVLGDTINALFDNARRMGIYFLQDEIDSVLISYNRTLSLFDTFGKREKLSLFNTYPLLAYLELGQYSEASMLLTEAQNNRELFKTLYEPSHGYELYYYYLGRIFEQEDKLDTADIFYREALQYGYEQEAYNGLMSVSRKLSQADSVFKYAELYASANDRQHRIQRTHIVEQTTKLYNHTLLSQRIYRLEQISATYKTTTALFALLLMLAYVIWQRYRIHVTMKQRAMREEQLNTNRDYAELMSKYRHVKYDMALLQERSVDTQFALNTTIHELEDTISQMRDSLAVDNKLKTLFDSDVYNRLVELVMPHKNMMPASDDDFEALSDLIKNIAPHYYSFITSGKLQPIAFRLCLCMTLLFSSSETAILLGVPNNRISNLKTEVNMKLFRIEGAKGLERNLMKNLF